jgi:hypothetical protein
MGGKRVRTSHRFETGYAIAVTSCQEGWSKVQRHRAIEAGLVNNEDLVEDKSVQQNRREWQRWSDPRLCGWHTRLRDYAERLKAAEPAGSNERLNHIFDRLCKEALEHPKGIEAALDAIGRRSRLRRPDLT